MAVLVNIITGFLGAGKTTTIHHLLGQRPPHERWAVLINEFGQVGIDAASLGQAADVSLRELPGGCLCCTLGAPLRVTLTRLLRDVRPDRLLIEPTGLGHPARLLDTLRSPGLGENLSLAASICLVDPRQLAEPRAVEHPVFIDQVQLADVLVAAKTDLALDEDMTRFAHWARSLYPAKARVLTIRNGELALDVLDTPVQGRRRPLFPDAHAHHSPAEPTYAAPAVPRPGEPVRLPEQGTEGHACGWIFHPDDTFDESRLTAALLAIRGVARLKGVFHCGRDWLLLQRDGEAVSRRPVGWRRDSRLEVILQPASTDNWVSVEAQLLDCLGRRSRVM